jgi:AAA+ ATPase superfamily predicted ATPase
MRNSLGNPARGDAFFDREKEIRKIYRALDSGASIYLSAPRRVGKTSILKYLEESPKEGYCFIYIITESVDNSNNFFKTIFDELVKSEAINRLAKISNTIKVAATLLISKVKSVNGVELREGKDANYSEILTELFSNITKDQGSVILMIDEFPQTIQNILDKEGKDAAKQFLQKNREIRQSINSKSNISFIYTGSVSLFPMIEKVTELTSINDVKTVNVDPLSEEDAKEFLAQLMETEGIKLPDESLNYIITKIGWLIPFHLQLIQQELIDVYESTNEAINNEAIDRAFEQVIHSRNKPQFEPYFSRLLKLFKGDGYNFVMEILKNIALNNSLNKSTLYDLSVKHNISDAKYIMDILEADGYIYFKTETYQYTSPILQLWCKKHIC